MTDFELNKAVADGEVFVPVTVVSNDPAGKRVDGYEKFDVFAECEAPTSIISPLEVAPCETFPGLCGARPDDESTELDLSEMDEAE